MTTSDSERAKEFRILAQGWRQRAGGHVGEVRQVMLEIAGNYDRLASQLERVNRLINQSDA